MPVDHCLYICIFIAAIETKRVGYAGGRSTIIPGTGLNNIVHVFLSDW
jgi:hypothetical protein